jgi:hypothetical protein
MIVDYSITEHADGAGVVDAVHRLLGTLDETGLSDTADLSLEIRLEGGVTGRPVRLDDVERTIEGDQVLVTSHAFRGMSRRQGRAFRISLASEPDPAKVCSGMRVLFASLVVHFDMLYVHAGSLSYQDRTWLFVGPSGAGKSTMTARLSGHLDGATFMDDDLTFLFLEDGRPHASLDPFECDRVKMEVEAGLPVGALFFLAGKGENRLERIGPSAAAARLASSALNVYEYEEQTRDALALVERMASAVPLFETWSRNDDMFLEMMRGKLERG